MRHDDSSASEDEAEWAEVIAQPRTEPTSAEGGRLAQLFARPPPLHDLKAMEGNVHRYSGVPETPPPRRHRVDNQLHCSRLSRAKNGHFFGMFPKMEKKPN